MAKAILFHPRLIRDALNNSIPKKFRQMIKPYQKSRWRKNPPVFIGEEYYENKGQIKHDKLINKLLAECRLHRLRKELSTDLKKYRTVTQGKEKNILKVIDKTATVLGIEKCCDLLGISIRKYFELKEKRNCTPPLYFFCNKRKPNQLTTSEVYKIKEILEEKRFLGLPMSKLSLYAIKEKIVSACYSSWRKIRYIFDIERKPFRRVDKRNKEGIRADLPNELLHSDFTKVEVEGKKYYIFFMIDNYSRFIVNACLAERGDLIQNIIHFKAAMDLAKETKFPLMTIMTDMGSENTANAFREAVIKSGLTHTLAQENGNSSNSMVERAFMSLKQFLRQQTERLTSVNQLKSLLNDFLVNYNFLLPMRLLNCRTPYEAYMSQSPSFIYAESINLAANERRRQNKELQCGCRN